MKALGAHESAVMQNALFEGVESKYLSAERTLVYLEGCGNSCWLLAGRAKATACAHRGTPFTSSVPYRLQRTTCTQEHL